MREALPFETSSSVGEVRETSLDSSSPRSHLGDRLEMAFSAMDNLSLEWDLGDEPSCDDSLSSLPEDQVSSPPPKKKEASRTEHK